MTFVFGGEEILEQRPPEENPYTGMPDYDDTEEQETLQDEQLLAAEREYLDESNRPEASPSLEDDFEQVTIEDILPKGG